MKINIYTDGSHLDKQHGGRLGCGGVMVDMSAGGMGQVIDSFSEELTPEKMKREFGADKCSNPTAEMVGVLTALRQFKFDDPRDITIYSDYEGCRAWMTGRWKIKEPYIRKVKELIDREINSKGLHVTFEWVRGHQSVMSPDSYYNNMADKLAKGEYE